MKKQHKLSWALLALAALVAGCAAVPSAADLNKLTRDVVKSSFRDEGIVKASVLLEGDETIQACSEADATGVPLNEAKTRALEAANFKSIQWPANDKYLGDWKEGEKIAQSGRGLTWTDTAATPNGGNCYNCHQIDRAEISYGTIGPSLYNFGKLRGVTDPKSPEARAMLEYTWGKVWNAKAYNACSNMPRAGHMGILTQAQVAHIVALLLDPKSPVNQ